jgi:hypothetical protein
MKRQTILARRRSRRTPKRMSEIIEQDSKTGLGGLRVRR